MTQWTEPPVSSESLQRNVVRNARDAGTLPGDDLSSAFPAVNSSDYVHSDANSAARQADADVPDRDSISSGHLLNSSDGALVQQIFSPGFLGDEERRIEDAYHSGTHYSSNSSAVVWVSEHGLHTFLSPPHPSGHSYTYEEQAIARMHELALQHQITGNVHSDSFWMGSYVLQVIAVFLQTGSFTLYASTPDPSTTGFSPAFKDHFLHLQRVFPSFSSDPIVREAVYAHSRLAISPRNTMISPRILKYSAGDNTSVRLLESGNPAFGLRPDQAVEATLDNLLIRGVETRDVAFCFQELLVDGMMDLCEEWLILLRHVVALEHDTTLKFATVDMHKQYMLKLAVLEENAALIAGYRICPLSGHLYKDITAKWQKLVQDLADSITSSIFTGDFGGDPSELECFHAREVGRIAGQWSLAYYIQNLERINRNAYYRSAVIGLREQYCSSVFPPLVFNDLPSAMRDAASNRRRYLTRCRTTLPVVPFDYELKPTVSWIPLTLQFPDFSSDLA